MAFPCRVLVSADVPAERMSAIGVHGKAGEEESGPAA